MQDTELQRFAALVLEESRRALCRPFFHFAIAFGLVTPLAIGMALIWTGRPCLGDDPAATTLLLVIYGVFSFVAAIAFGRGMQ